jgi:hypothetical protein
MKKLIFIWLALIICNFNIAFAQDEEALIRHDMSIQNRINHVGVRLLNANKIDVRMGFVYSKKGTRTRSDLSSLKRRQILAYDKNIQFADSDAEIAAFLAREICKCSESYSGMGKGSVTALQILAAPKKYEMFFDKRAVDFMVTAGYNPLAMITYMNKAYPQKRQDLLSRTNLTSKRMANIYEYIYFKYPIFLAQNEYIRNEYYQNFLLTSQENRRKLHEKIKSGSREKIKYE